MNPNQRASRHFLGLVAASLSLALLSCTVAAGAGVGAVVVGAAAATSGCYDAVDLRLIDATTGLRTCAARVVAVSTDGSETRFTSCYHAALPRGDWTLRAEQRGYAPASARVIVEQHSGCEPAVQSIELVLHLPGERPVAPVVAAPSLPPAPPSEPAAVETPPGAPAAEAPPSGAMPAPSAAPPGPPAPSAPLSPSAPSAPSAPPAPPAVPAPEGAGGAPPNATFPKDAAPPP